MSTQRKDIRDELILELLDFYAMLRAKFPTRLDIPGSNIVEVLESIGMPEKVVVSKLEHMAERGLIEYGVSIYYPWRVRE